MKVHRIRSGLIAALAITFVGGTAGAGNAAEPPAAEEAPVGGLFAHQHIVMTGQGCLDLDHVLFEPALIGLHHAAAVTGPDQGPWHIFPGLGCDDLP